MKWSNTLHHGITTEQLHEMRGIFARFPGIESVTLFWSRAKWTQKPASDIDLAIEYIGNNPHDIFSIRSLLEEETRIPYFFDVVDIHSITSPELREHIREYGIQIA